MFIVDFFLIQIRFESTFPSFNWTRCNKVEITFWFDERQLPLDVVNIVFPDVNSSFSCPIDMTF